MKKLLVLLVCISSFGQSKPAIEHAPTVDQCRADGMLWASQYPAWVEATDNGRPFGTALGHIDMEELLARRSEMQDCQTVDTTSAKRYNEVYYYLNTAIAKRCILYLFQTNKIEDYDRWELGEQKGGAEVSKPR